MIECLVCGKVANQGIADEGNHIYCYPCAFDKGLLNRSSAEKIVDMNKTSFEDKRRRLIEYLIMKTEEADWHGVSDAANDLRELEAEHRGKK